MTIGKEGKRPYYRGVLIRLWIVLSFVWTGLLALSAAVDRRQPGGEELLAMFFPWMIGPVLYYAFRFVRGY